MNRLTVEQKADLLQRAFTGLATPQDILFAVDGSGSVQVHQWETMKFCIRTLVNYLGLKNVEDPSYRVGGLQFDNGVYVISHLTADALAFNTAVVSTPQRRGGTNAGLALTTCINMFAADDRNNCHKTIVLMTDGDVSGAQAIQANLTQKNITLISIGVGLSGNTETAVMALSDHAIFVNDFSEMSLVVSYLSVKPGCTPEINPRTRSSKQASFDIVSSTPFTRVDIEILRENSNKWTPFGFAESNVFYATGLEPNSVYSLRGKAINGTAVTGWSEVTEIRTLRENPETAVLQGRDLPDRVRKMVEKLECYAVPSELKHFGIDYLNIALLGRIGNGKSAFFNTIWSIMNGSYDEPQLTKSDITTVTLEIRKRFLKNNRNNAIRLCDTYGWKGGDSWSQELEFFLDGALRDGYKENSDLLKSLNKEPTVGDRVHAVIIVYEMPSIYTDSHIDELKKFFAKMTSKGYQPIVILTKPDLVPEADITGKLEAIFDTGIIDSHIQEFSTRTKIPLTNIFPVMNYTGQYSEPEWVREKLALNAFHAAIQFANTKIANDLKKHIIVEDTKGDVIGTATFDGASETTLDVIRERILQCIPSLKDFVFVNQQASETPVNAEECTALTRVAKSDNTYSYWTVTVIPRAASKTLQQVPVGIDLTVPDTLTIIKDGKPEGAVLVEPKHVTLSDLRKLIEEEIELKGFQFLKPQNTPVPFLEEANTAIVACLVNQDTIVVTDLVLSDLTASDLASDQFPLVVLNNKDKSSLGACIVEKSMTLRQLEEIMTKDIEVPTGFVFLCHGAVIKPKQLDNFRVKHIMFKQEGAECIAIAEPEHA